MEFLREVIVLQFQVMDNLHSLDLYIFLMEVVEVEVGMHHLDQMEEELQARGDLVGDQVLGEEYHLMDGQHLIQIIHKLDWEIYHLFLLHKGIMVVEILLMMELLLEVVVVLRTLPIPVPVPMVSPSPFSFPSSVLA